MFHPGCGDSRPAAVHVIRLAIAIGGYSELHLRIRARARRELSLSLSLSQTGTHTLTPGGLLISPCPYRRRVRVHPDLLFVFFSTDGDFLPIPPVIIIIWNLPIRPSFESMLGPRCSPVHELAHFMRRHICTQKDGTPGSLTLDINRSPRA